MRTPTTQATLTDAKLAQKLVRALNDARLREPIDAAAMLVFLTSHAAGWITGQAYPVNAAARSRRSLASFQGLLRPAHPPRRHHRHGALELLMVWCATEPGADQRRTTRLSGGVMMRSRRSKPCDTR